MFFSDTFRAMLASRLRPWLLAGQEPLLDLHVGFRTFQLKAANLSLDPSVLNSTLDDSSPFYFKELVLREVELRFSPWSIPSVNVSVKSLNVDIALREVEPLSGRACSQDIVDKERKRLIASIDSEGALFHDLVENLSAQSPQKRLVAILKNTILRCSAIHFDEIQFHLHCDEAQIFTLKAQKLCLEPSHPSNTSLFNGFISSSITPGENNIFLSITCPSLDFEIKDNTRIQQVLSFTGLSVLLKFQNLQLSAFGIKIAKLDCTLLFGSISSILLLLDKTTHLCSVEHNAGTRNGKELWCIASRRLHPRNALYKSIDIVRTWQRYVSAYMVLLSMIGYHDEKILRKNCTKLQSTGNSSIKRNVSYQLAILNQLEEKLPIEAIAKGRRIARLRKSSDSRSNTNKSWVYLVRVPFLKILSLVWLLLGFILYIYRFLVRVFGTKLVDTGSFLDSFFDISSDLDTPLHYIIFLGELKFALFISEGCDPEVAPLHLTVNSLIQINSSDSVRKSLFLGLGDLKLSSDRQNLVLWSDPACRDYLSDIGCGPSSSFGMLWSKWTQIIERYEEIDAGTTYEGPFFLCEFNSTVYDYGLQQCNLVLGKLNLSLDLESVILFYRVYRVYNKIFEGIQTSSASSISLQPEQTRGSLLGSFKLFTERMMKLGSVFVPRKSLQIATVIEGPQIRVKLEKDWSAAAIPVSHFLLDLGIVEFLVTPLTENSRDSEMNMKYSYRWHASHECYFRLGKFGIEVEHLGVNHNSPILGPASMNFNLSVTRDLLESLSCFEDHLSTALRGNVFGASAFLYLDEILTSFQAVQSILSAISSAYTSLHSENPIYSPCFTKRSRLVGNKDKKYEYAQLMMDTIIESEPVHIVLKHSRIDENVNVLKFGLGFSISKTQLRFSFSEEQMKATVDFSQVEALILEPTIGASESEKLHCFSLSKCMFGLELETEMHVNIELVRLFVADYCLNGLLGGSDQPLKILLLASDDCQSVKCEIQGGFIFLETSTVAEYANCLNACLLLVEAGRIKVSNSGTHVPFDCSPSQRQNELGSYLVREVEIDLSQFSLTLAVADETGVVQELNISADINLQVLNFGRKISYDVSCLSICKNSWARQITSQNNHPLAHFRSDNSTSVQVLQVEELVQSPILSHEGYILKEMSAYAEIEKIDLDREVSPTKLTSNWVGTAGFSGLDLNVSLSTIQMFLALSSPLDRVRNGRSDQESAAISDSDDQTQRDATDCKIPDGAIVTIMDLDQHMYMAIEAVETKFLVVGVLHYSIAGERALFKVRHHKRWRSEEQIISFSSLYRPEHNTSEICLSYNSGSGFVETSSSSTKPVSLWKMIPVQSRKIEDYDTNNDDVKSFNLVPEDAFHLVNCKSNLGIGFIDGVPEFVKKPGSVFRVKVLQNFLGEVPGTIGNAPSVDVRAENISLTILHDVSDARDEVPLVRGCITDWHVVAHSTFTKVRMLGSFNASVQYFDGRKDEWKDVVSPVPSFFLFRYRFSSIPIRFFFGAKQMNIYVNEPSVDILLYLAGKLDLSGPYAVRQSAIFPNSCKIENQSGLSLLCHFPNNQDVIVSPRQASSIFLRHLAVLGSENSVLISLVKQGTFSTSPVLVSLADTCIFAWRTRITSVNGSRSFPGPFVVVEVSKQCEEGLCLSVSPLLRLHNKSEFPIELRFARPNEPKDESAFVTLRSGDTIDESMGVFDAIDLSGGSRRALLSLALGNFLLSFKPVISEQHLEKYNLVSASADWSEDITGDKAVRVSGVLDKLNYKLRRAFGFNSFNSLFNCLSCPLSVEGIQVSDLHFLVHTVERNVPLQSPLDGGSNSEKNSTLPVALRMQREIFIYPTVQVFNFLQSAILVIIGKNQTDLNATKESHNVGREAAIPCGSSSYFYVNPSNIYFSVTLMVNGSKCKPVDSGECARRLGKRTTEIQYFDMELQFDTGKHSASLRFLRGEKGLLEVAVFTKYTLKNSSDLPLLCTPFYPKSLSRFGTETTSSHPEHEFLLHPASSVSWFAKSTEVYIRSADGRTSVVRIDMGALSAFTELCLEMEDSSRGNSLIAVLAVSVCPSSDHTVNLPAQVVHIVPRYVIANQSSEDVIVRQCYAEDDMDDIVVEAKKRVILLTRKTRIRGRETLFDSLLRGHKNGSDESQVFVQFSLKEARYRWSGPVCVKSIGRFFVKFRIALDDTVTDGSAGPSRKSTKLASVHVVEENNSLVLKYTMPPDYALPYRIENRLPGSSIMYFQKGSTEVDMLDPGESAEYVWDDINLPHKLVVRIVDMNLLREISIDKVCQWRPFFKMQNHRGLGLHLMSLSKGIFPTEKGRSDESLRQRPLEVGYEVDFDGLTRVLRVCERANFTKVDNSSRPFANVQLRWASAVFHLREIKSQSIDEAPQETTILVLNLAFMSVDSVMAYQQKYISTRIQSINAEERWNGASFGSILRRSRDYDASSNENILSISLVLSSTKSKIKQVEYLSLLLQPIDLKIDEETLMKLVPFWRSSLSDSSAPSQKYYFKHFEIHPIKITASFRPGISHTTYSSAQEALRSLLHTVVQVPPINNSVVELNGVLLNHALVTSRELLFKCAQHYSWYMLRAVYVVKGSKLLPPTFASIFDDSALSSLDIFFDPSDGSISLPGVTMGMFKFISKGIKSKGYGTKRYLGDIGKTIERAGSKALFAVVTEISDSVLRGAETNGFNGMVKGFHQGILRLAMEPSVLGLAIVDGGPDRKIKLVRSPGLDELYIEGYLQGMLDVSFKLEYLRVRVIDDQVILKNLPPSSTVIREIMENVKGFLISKGLLQGDPSASSRPIRQLHTEREWRLGPTMLTLCEHLFVSFAIRLLHKEATKVAGKLTWKGRKLIGDGREKPQGGKIWVVGGFLLSGVVAYVDGRLCRHIPNPIARRIVSGFLLSFLDRKDSQQS